MKRLLVFFGLIYFIVGCSPDVVDGGSCKYVALEDIAKVTKIYPSIVVLSGIQSYEVEIKDFQAKPNIGEKFRVKGLSITEGSCNPISIHSVEKV